MTNFSKIKTRNKLGTPPSEQSAKDHLTAPEVAPVGYGIKKPSDGRSARSTGRIEPIATRVRAGVRQKYKKIAARDEITMGELLERAIEAYEKLQEN